MPVIREDDETLAASLTDFPDLLDLPEPAFTTSEDVLGGTTLAAEPSNTEYLSNDYLGDWDLSAPSNDPYGGLEEPDYGKFENWIPQFIRPAKPCDYCRLRRLNCYITCGETGCTPCNALFRECSLTKSGTLEGLNSATGHLLDTLHVVDEDAAKEQGTLTGIKPLRSKAGAGSGSSARPDDAPGSSKRNGIRFPRHAVKILRDWLDLHADNPYPTEEEKAELEQRTELKPSQIANWLANSRRRRKVTEKARRPLSSPSLGPSTPAIAIPAAEKPWDELDPFERWKHSPPENEPASMTDIVKAVVNNDLPDDQVSTSPSSNGRRKKRSSAGSGFSNARAQSTTSFETGHTSSLSASTSAAYSQHSSQSRGSFGSFSSSLAGKKDRRRRRRPAPTALRKPGDEKKRIFQCTFCTDTFKSKYDWTRHEKSLHLSLEKWICAPLGPVVTDPATGKKRCVYCDEKDPSDEHLETHNDRQCADKGHDARTFYRKDHLRQHLRLMHNCEMIPFMDNWKSTAVNINSRCGFCAKRFTVWQERVDHLTAHFKAGARMSEWKGCRGLDPNVAAQVTNAMPPYLIGIESVSPNPFSATNRATWEHSNPLVVDIPELGNLYARNLRDAQVEQSTSGLPDKATCWEILTVRLGRYANEMSKQGVVLTDEMLQTYARRILYESDDTWNQTAADNPEWLDLFKKAHGLNFIPSTVGGEGHEIPEDLETYGDLGLRIPFSVQLQSLNASEARKQEESELERTLWSILSKEGVLHDVNGKCKHTECEDNIFDFHSMEGNESTRPKNWRWCTYQLPPDKARKVAALTSPARVRDRVDDEEERANNIARGLASLNESGNKFSSADSCPWDDYDAQVFKAKARVTALSALSRAEGPLPMSPDPKTGLPKKPFLQRHRYELPREKAQRFATTTGAWVDSGSMPAPISTATMPSGLLDSLTTSTGAMMEFLGGDMGQHLPFSADENTARIPLPDFDWGVPMTAEERGGAIDLEVDRLIAETTAAQTQQAMMSAADGSQMSELPTAATMGTVGEDFPMSDFDFDMEMDFDGVFDMPLDETFGPIEGTA